MPFTRTHTVFFDDDDLAPLRRAILDLQADADGRAPHISAGAAKAVEARLGILALAAELLAEPVSESM